LLDVAKETRAVLGLGPMIILLAIGVATWLAISKTAAKPNPAKTINTAFWLHSVAEGALAAVSFSFGFRAGLVVVSALLLHLLPESLAIIAALKQAGYKLDYIIKSYLISVALLVGSFSLFIIMPQINETLLFGLSTIVAGGFIVLALNLSRRVFQTN
jgi:zinc transporter ZupT